MSARARTSSSSALHVRVARAPRHRSARRARIDPMQLVCVPLVQLACSLTTQRVVPRVQERTTCRRCRGEHSSRGLLRASFFGSKLHPPPGLRRIERSVCGQARGAPTCCQRVRAGEHARVRVARSRHLLAGAPGACRAAGPHTTRSTWDSGAVFTLDDRRCAPPLRSVHACTRV